MRVWRVVDSSSGSNGNSNSSTVSFHNFKSQNFKLSVSNPKSKYVAYLSVLSQISNGQSLGRKNKHEILKTDRSDSSSLSRRIASHRTLSCKASLFVRSPAVDVYVCIYIYIYTHIYIYICICSISLSLSIYIYMYTCVYSWMTCALCATTPNHPAH